MKVLVILSVLTFVALSHCRPELRDCYYDTRGLCMGYCEVGTHSYSSSCGGKMTPEPTCDNPNPEEEEGLCDYSACYCDAPTVRNTATGKCVPLKECPQKKNYTPLI